VRTFERARRIGRALAVLALLSGSVVPVQDAHAGAQPQVTGAASAATTPAPRLAVPDKGAYTGAYIEFGETEDKVTLERLEWFEQTVGKHQAIVAFSNFWGQGGFPVRTLRIVDAYGAVPLLFWSPWEPPYSASSSGKFSLERILAGENDAYIDEWGRQAAA
jgi:hypothetical protein